MRTSALLSFQLHHEFLTISDRQEIKHISTEYNIKVVFPQCALFLFWYNANVLLKINTTAHESCHKSWTLCLV